MIMSIKQYIIGLLALASVACNDYLDVQPSKTTSLVPSTTDHLEYLLNDYNTFYMENNYTAVFSSDDFGLYTDIYNVQPIAYPLETVEFALWDLDYLPAASSDNFWTGEYEKIFIANMVLEYIPQVSGDEATKARLKAEAHLVRAYSLWELANTYCLPYTEANKGELGLVLKQSTSFDESEERATLEATYQLIEQDIQEALKSDVELTMVNGKYQTWRASLPAAYAFAARYYLFRNNYGEALNYANKALEKHSELMDYNTDMRYSATVPTVTINPGTENEEVVEILYPYTHDSQSDMNDRLEWREFYYFRVLSNVYWWFLPATELMDLYDKNIRYKKDLDRFVSKPMRRDYLLATKAYDYLHYAGSALDLHRAYTLVCDALESVEDRPLCYLLLTWMDVNLRIYRADSSFKDTYLKDYQNAVSLIRRSYEASGSEERRMWNETLALVNDMFRESGLAGQLTAQAAEPLAYNKEEELLR